MPTIPHPLRLRLVERPAFRVRFLSPDLQEHRATLSTTWLASPSFNTARSDAHPEQAIAFREGLLKVIKKVYAEAGCQVTGLEVVSSSTADIQDESA